MAGVAEGWACAFDKLARDTLLNGYEFSLRVEHFCRVVTLMRVMM